jgi:hypothetical protein
LELSSLKEIAKYARNNHVTHILFPGLDDSSNISVEVIQRLYSDLSVIIELFYKKKQQLFAIEKGKILNKPIQQKIIKSTDNIELYQNLYEDTFKEKSRIIKVGGINFLIWICGEINMLKNKQAENNRVEGLRYTHCDEDIHDLNYDVFFNPTHTTLKTLNDKYKKRLKYLSFGNRYAILCLNVPPTQKQRNGAIFVFKNRKELIEIKDKKKWEKSKWVMEIIEYKKPIVGHRLAC